MTNCGKEKRSAATAGGGRLFRAGVLAAALAVAVTAAATASSGVKAKPTTFTPVIVRANPAAEPRVEGLMRALGGRVQTRLAIVNGFSAIVPSTSVPKLRALPGVLSVTLNTRLQPTGSSYEPGGDSDSMASTASATGARDWWAAGYTGAGIDVAVIDTGVSPVDGLRGTDKLVYGPDLSLESQAPNLTHLDTYGHGTFVAGLIAGRDGGAGGSYADAPASTYLGMAPDSRIVSIKVGTADGGTDVSQVIAAIDWTVQHAHDPGLNIRVLNLSYGTNSTQTYMFDPLAFAAEQAWKHGIVVVAAAGNTGYQRGSGAPGLADPAYDPFLIAVGASDSMGTPDTKDDRVAAFSASAGCGGCRTPDLVAPGTHLQGLRVGGSWLDGNHPSARLGDRYFRGSGTSQSTAITSGAVALVLQRYPELTPDLVKGYLEDSARNLKGSGKTAQGEGGLQLELKTAPRRTGAAQHFAPSAGKGRLELSRGQDHISRDGVVLSGERDIFGRPFDAANMAQLEASGSSWSGGNWNGSSWSGSSWSGSSWSGSSWPGSSWSVSSWSGSSWSGSSWSGSSWSGSSWSGSSWSGSSWSGSSWSGSSWSDASWS